VNQSSQPKIVCVMRIKNEEQWIAQVLGGVTRGG